MQAQYDRFGAVCQKVRRFPRFPVESGGMGVAGDSQRRPYGLGCRASFSHRFSRPPLPWGGTEGGCGRLTESPLRSCDGGTEGGTEGGWAGDSQSRPYGVAMGGPRGVGWATHRVAPTELRWGDRGGLGGRLTESPLRSCDGGTEGGWAGDSQSRPYGVAMGGPRGVGRATHRVAPTELRWGDRGGLGGRFSVSSSHSSNSVVKFAIFAASSRRFAPLQQQASPRRHSHRPARQRHRR